jgi:hypothetical protein
MPTLKVITEICKAVSVFSIKLEPMSEVPNTSTCAPGARDAEMSHGNYMYKKRVKN